MTDFAEKYGPYAVVTGASAGIGEEFARQLAQRGLNLVLVARRTDRLTELALTLSTSFGITAKPVALDLLLDDAVETLVRETDSLDVGLVIPNAGVVDFGPFLDAPLQKHTDLVLLNAVRPMQLAHHFGRRLARRGRGGILFVASIVGHQPVPYEANYAASKAYVSSLGQALRVEFARSGVDVTVLAPGLVNTDMLRDAPVDTNKLPFPMLDPPAIVKAALDGLGTRAVVIPGATNLLTDVAFKHLVPRWAAPKLLGPMLRRTIASH